MQEHSGQGFDQPDLVKDVPVHSGGFDQTFMTHTWKGRNSHMWNMPLSTGSSLIKAWLKQHGKYEAPWFDTVVVFDAVELVKLLTSPSDRG